MDDKILDDVLSKMPDSAKFDFFMLLSGIKADAQIASLVKRVQALEGNLAKMRLRFAHFEKDNK